MIINQYYVGCIRWEQQVSSIGRGLQGVNIKRCGMVHRCISYRFLEERTLATKSKPKTTYRLNAKFLQSFGL